MVALSDSSVMSDCSLVTASPGLTRTSMTSTSLKSPMSGTRTWLMRSSGSYGGRVRFVGVDAVLLDGLGNGLRLHLAGIHQGPQRGDRGEAAIDLEEVAQLGARVGAAEAVGPEHAVAAALRDERPDLVGEGLHVVARRDDRTWFPTKSFSHIRHARFRLGVKQVPPLGGEAIAAQLGEAGGAPDVGRHAPLGLEHLRRGEHLAQDGARAEKLHADLMSGFCFS